MFKSQDGGTFNCPHCSAVYSVTYTQTPFRDSDHATCDVCKNAMDEWNSATFPRYKLVKRPVPLE